MLRFLALNQQATAIVCRELGQDCVNVMDKYYHIACQVWLSSQPLRHCQSMRGLGENDQIFHIYKPHSEAFEAPPHNLYRMRKERLATSGFLLCLKLAMRCDGLKTAWCGGSSLAIAGIASLQACAMNESRRRHRYMFLELCQGTVMVIDKCELLVKGPLVKQPGARRRDGMQCALCRIKAHRLTFNLRKLVAVRAEELA